MPSDIQPSYHYGVVKRAIELIDERGPTMALEDLAGEMNMSPAHFQRVFSKWAGVSPKRLQQYLTLGHAKELLAAHATTLETADAVGLSRWALDRVHEAIAAREAKGNPGHFRSRGSSMSVGWVKPTPVPIKDRWSRRSCCPLQGSHRLS